MIIRFRPYALDSPDTDGIRRSGIAVETHRGFAMVSDYPNRCARACLRGGNVGNGYTATRLHVGNVALDAVFPPRRPRPTRRRYTATRLHDHTPLFRGFLAQYGYGFRLVPRGLGGYVVRMWREVDARRCGVVAAWMWSRCGHAVQMAVNQSGVRLPYWQLARRRRDRRRRGAADVARTYGRGAITLFRRLSRWWGIAVT